jgi:hypothetical protein
MPSRPIQSRKQATHAPVRNQLTVSNLQTRPERGIPAVGLVQAIAAFKRSVAADSCPQNPNKRTDSL